MKETGNPMNLIAEQDTEFQDHQITEVRDGSAGWWEIGVDGGWWLSVPKVEGVEPRVGSSARFYGRKYGSVRGVFIDGREVYYRTEAEDEEHQAIQLYGKDAAEWLARWDRGDGVWSVEMGGLGPGYEQCIQIVAAEVVRHCLAAKYDATRWEAPENWKADRDAMDKAVSPVVAGMGLSGAQWGAGLQLGARLYRDGPRGVHDSAPEERRIQVSRAWPQAPTPSGSSSVGPTPEEGK